MPKFKIGGKCGLWTVGPRGGNRKEKRRATSTAKPKGTEEPSIFFEHVLGDLNVKKSL